MKRYLIKPTLENNSSVSESAFFDEIMYGVLTSFSSIEIQIDLDDDLVEMLRSMKRTIDIEDLLDSFTYNEWGNAVYTMGNFVNESFSIEGSPIEHHNKSLVGGEDYIKAYSFYCPITVEEIV